MTTPIGAPKAGAVGHLARIAGEPGVALKGFIDAIYADTRLDAKTRELVFLGVQTALNLEDSVRAHLPRAIAAGASRDEIVAAMMVAVANGGLGGALRFVPLVDEVMKQD